MWAVLDAIPELTEGQERFLIAAACVGCMGLIAYTAWQSYEQDQVRARALFEHQLRDVMRARAEKLETPAAAVLRTAPVEVGTPDAPPSPDGSPIGEVTHIMRPDDFGARSAD